MDRKIDHIVRTARLNLCDGQREEPRLYFDRITLPLMTADAEAFNGDPQTFVNGEPWPVRITRLIFSLGLSYSTVDSGPRVAELGPPVTQSALAGVGLRLRRSDEYYMNHQHIPIPSWVNRVTASPMAFGAGGSSWTFDRPCVLSVRDVLDVDVQALASRVNYQGVDEQDPQPFEATITVTASGVGLQTMSPKFFGGSIVVTDSRPVKIPSSLLQNNSAEPVAITDLSVQTSFSQQSVSNNAYLASDQRFFAIQCRQLQNGTRSKWFQGPTTPTPIGLCNASLLGLTSGMALVHDLPGDGVLLEPGQGFIAEGKVLTALPDGVVPADSTNDVWIGMAGYAMVV